MTTNRFTVLLQAAVVVCAAAAYSLSCPAEDLARGAYSGDAASAERILLVLYKSRPQHHVPSGARVSMYRSRGVYAASSFDRRQLQRIARHYGLEQVTDWRISEIGMHCGVFRVPEGKDVDATLKAIRSDSSIELVQRMATYKTMSSSSPDPYFELQASAKYFNLAEAHGIATGRGVSVAMIDTGVALEHPDLVGQVAAAENFVRDISPAFNTDAHGTAVAGIIAAKRDNGQGIVGVAPDAELTALKACWPQHSGALAARCNSFTLALALNTAIQMNPAVLNMSLTGPPDEVVALLIKEAHRRGIIIVAAIPENSSADDGFPARMPEVIGVCADELLLTDTVAAGHDQTVRAPSREILTTVPEGRYDFLSGSSLAAAQVSGYIALIKELDPQLNTHAIRRYLADADARNLRELADANLITQIARATPDSAHAVQ